jgi:alanine racemase
MSIEAQTTWLEINLAAIRRNIQRLIEISNRPVMAVVKANAYGHGLVEVSKAVVEAGAIRLCVARMEEALALRESGVTIPILVMGMVMPSAVGQAIKHRVSLMVDSIENARQFNLEAIKNKGRLCVHIKVDTGMHRLGILPEQVVAFTQAIKSMEGIFFEGIFTHFANADDPGDPTTKQHLRSFGDVIEALERQGSRPPIVHASNSAASLYFPDAKFDAIRPGIAIYGLNPSSEAPLPKGFEPALTWKGRLSALKLLPPNSGVGYNYRYFTSSTERIGVATTGYADGLRRRLGNIALINGKKVHQIGGMCMDQSIWSLKDLEQSKIGDEIVFVGQQGESRITAEEVGTLWGSNDYDVVCGLAARLPRFYFEK